MKRIKGVMLLCVVLLTLTNNCGEKLLGLYKFQYYSYYGARVEQLLSAIKVKYRRYAFLHEPPGLLVGCAFLYKGIQVKVYVSEFKYIKNRFSLNSNWDIELFKKETISKIRIKKVKF